jgi:bacterial/archaeal transporter family protein
MQWIVLSLLSAVVLGIYGLAKKAAVHENAVPPVLLLNVATAALLYLPVIAVSWLRPSWLGGSGFFVEAIPVQYHALLFCKSGLVGASWILAFYALKHLPISIADPIRATSPFWTVLIASTFFAERPSPVQWLGILVILTAFFAFSRVGSQEGIHFSNNRWVTMMIGATLLGAISALYDKFLLQRMCLTPATVQAWFSIYLVLAMFPLATHWYVKDRHAKPFEFRWSIPCIAITLLISDFLYFQAVSDPQAMIAIVSPIRRTSVVIAFLYGVLRLSEKNWRAKAMCIAVMLIGVYLVCWQPSLAS